MRARRPGRRHRPCPVAFYPPVPVRSCVRHIFHFNSNLDRIRRRCRGSAVARQRPVSGGDSGRLGRGRPVRASEAPVAVRTFGAISIKNSNKNSGRKSARPHAARPVGPRTRVTQGPVTQPSARSAPIAARLASAHPPVHSTMSLPQRQRPSEIVFSAAATGRRSPPRSRRGWPQRDYW